MLTRTATAQRGAGDHANDGDGGDAGVVLLYAEDWKSLPAALALRSSPSVAERPFPRGSASYQARLASTRALQAQREPGSSRISRSRNGAGERHAGDAGSACPRDHVRIGDVLFKFVSEVAEGLCPLSYRWGGPTLRRPVPEMKGGLCRFTACSPRLNASRRRRCPSSFSARRGRGKSSSLAPFTR